MSSLREFDNLYDRIRLHRQVDKRGVIVVEGPSDKRIIERLFEESVSIFVATTRSLVIDTAEDIEGLGLNRVACIIDKDFGHDTSRVVAENRCLITWYGADLEQMLAYSPAWNHVLNELGSAEKIQNIGGVDTVRSRVVEAAAAVARLRVANARRQWGLSFDSIDLTNKVSSTDLSPSLQGIVSSLARTSDQHPGIAAIIAVTSTTDLPRCEASGLELVSGKDMAAVLAVGLRKLFGSRKRIDVQPSILTSALHLAVDVEWFRRTDWFRSLTSLLDSEAESELGD